MVGFVAENVMSGKSNFAPWDVVEKNADATLLDVREAAELMAFSIDRAKHLPL